MRNNAMENIHGAYTTQSGDNSWNPAGIVAWRSGYLKQPEVDRKTRNKMESSHTGNGPEENDKTGGCRHGEQVATINHDMPLFALKHNLDLNRSLFLTVTFYLRSFGERERCYSVC